MDDKKWEDFIFRLGYVQGSFDNYDFVKAFLEPCGVTTLEVEAARKALFDIAKKVLRGMIK